MAGSTEDIQRRLATKLATIRANQNLSAEGKARLVAKEYVAAKRDMAALKDSASQATATKRNALERRLFGLPSGADPSAVISWRDASDRASQVKTPQEAQQLLQRAALGGDNLLAKAVLGRAFEAGWPTLVDQYVAQMPGAASDVDALIQINAEQDEAASPQARFANNLAYSVGLPPELANVSDVERLAAEATSVVEQAPTPADSSDLGLTPAIGGGLRLGGDTRLGRDGWS